MSVVTARILPDNPLFCIDDGSDTGVIPEIVRDQLVMSTPSFLMVCCLPEVDGETEIALGPVELVDPGHPPAFEGVLDTPTGKVVVSLVSKEVVLEHPVSGSRTKLRIWANHPVVPDHVIIGLIKDSARYQS